MLASKGLAVFANPGAGKTSIVLKALTVLRQRTLIIAPIQVCHNVWPREIAKWDNFNHLKYVVLHGKDKDEQLKQAVYADIILINPEGMPWLLSHKNILKLLDIKILIVDESTLYKNYSSKRFKLLKPLLEKFERRYILTGTPIPRSYIDLFSQMMIVDRGESLGIKISDYYAKHFRKGGFKGKEWVLRDNEEDNIHRRCSDYVIRIDKKSFDLPDTVVNNVIIKADEGFYKRYKEIEKDMFLTLDKAINDEGGLLAESAAGKTTLLRTLCQGFVYNDRNKKDVIQLNNFKGLALQSIVNELSGSPLLVSYFFQAEVDLLRQLLGDNVKFLLSTKYHQSQADKNRIISNFNKGNVPVLCINPASISHGLNLQQNCHNVCWYTPIHNLEHYLQFNARVIRQGNKKESVTVHHLLIENTYDLFMMEQKNNKELQQTNFLKALLWYQKNHFKLNLKYR